MRVLGVESVSDPKQYTKLWVCKCVEYVYIYVAKNHRVRMPEFKYCFYYGQITLSSLSVLFCKIETVTILSS